MKKMFLTALVSLSFLCCLSAQTPKQIYEWRVYTTTSAARLDKYMKEVLIPAYNRHGISVGAYGEYSMTMPAKQYYLFVYADLADYQRVKTALENDKAYVDGAAADNPLNPPFLRYETYLSEAFEAWPRITKSTKPLLEWRIYEGGNDDALRRKVKMFNDGEIPIFVESGIEPFMFGQILAGPDMPALMYITRFDNMESRDAAWAKFGPHPKWIAMKDKEEYANTVSKIHRTFLVPLPYTQW